MTYKERLSVEHPDIDILDIVRKHCPHDYWFNAECHTECGGGATQDTCAACWDREEVCI